MLKSLPNLFKVTVIELTSESSVNPPAGLVFDLLNQMKHLSTIRLSNDYFIELIQYPLAKTILSKQIQSLTIRFQRNSLTLDDFIQIEKIFSSNLHFLYIQIEDLGYLNENLDLILLILFSYNWKELYQFNLRFSPQTSNSFDRQFQSNFHELIYKQKQMRKSLEYAIDNQQFSICF